MTRFLILIAVVSFGLSFSFFNTPEIAQAQTPRIGIDTIRLMAATRGTNFDGTGLKWCVSQTWHRGVPGLILDISLDEVPQTAAGCVSSSTEQVEFAAFGLTTSTSCTTTSPCESLYARVTSGLSTPGDCNYIAIRLLDYHTVNTVGPNGNFRGRQRTLHTTGPSGYTLVVKVSNGAWYSSGQNWWTVGTVVNDINCRKVDGTAGFSPGEYHVHQDFMPPTQSDNCVWNKNTSLGFASGATNQRRDNPDVWYIYSVEHKPGLSCLKAGGERASDFLLRPGGELDGPTPNSGQGARSLTTGGTITTSSTCFSGTSWCGTMTVTPPLLRAAHSYDQGWPPLVFLRGQQQSLPPKGVDRYWYGHDVQGYVFWVRDADVVFRNTVISCSDFVYAGERLYYLNFRSSANITCPNGQNWDGAGTPTTYRVAERHVNYIWSQFRGINGINPSQPPTQEEANTWAQTWIDTGHWLNVVKPAMDAVIRTASSTMDLATLGIAGNPQFDGDLGDVGLAAEMNVPNRVAFRITEPPLSNFVPDSRDRDWILSSPFRWKPESEGFKIYLR